jgi:NADPH:quinone reductase-like Zn-dependent oxidoreductase
VSWSLAPLGEWVGSYAVQIARALGADVTGVASTAKLDLVRSLGAAHVVDYTREDFAEVGERYDLILDIGGNPSVSRLRRALTPTGTAVIVGGESGGDLTGGMGRTLRALAMSPFIGQRFVNFINKERGADLERLGDLIAAGQLTPSIDRTFPLAEVPAAIALLAAGRVRGKLAITL